ncbi:unnamed protein product [Callosobruchus maculatus]|uniref:Glycoside hydrolase family protein 28 n=1 Tax=Callosobruchus maculatus TaxID=64391 RepID=A0A653DBS3_CALMS|nr:unnamed protein product [Callosobruchus maculatus]
MFRLSLTILITISAANAAIYNVTLFGADPSGTRPSTDAINLAISTAAANNGGIVHLSAGSYSTGPIELMDGVVLDIAPGCVVTFLPDPQLYPPITVKLPDGKLRHLAFTPLIRATGKRNVGIKGGGILEGNGPIWWDRLPPPASRPFFFYAFDSHNIVLTGITIRNSPMFNVHICDSTGIAITGITIFNPPDWKGKGANTDGINCNSCRQLHISGATIHTGDDCIALDAGGKRNKRIATTNVLIENCHMTAGHAGVSIGSVTTGGLHNITVRNSLFENTKRGLFIKTNRLRGGLIRDIRYSNINMNNVKGEGIAVAMVYNAKHQDYHDRNIPREPIKDTTPFIYEIEYDGISGTCGNEPVLLVGLPESPVRNIHINNFSVRSLKHKGNYLYNTQNIYINDQKQ